MKFQELRNKNHTRIIYRSVGDKRQESGRDGEGRSRGGGGRDVGGCMGNKGNLATFREPSQ